MLMESVFERALLRIPPQLRKRPGARFVVIINGNKKPEGKDWSGPNGANYGIDDAPLAGYLAEGHNYGILTGHAGITVPDLDDPARLEQLGIMARIPTTCQVRTGRGGLHVYLDCPELDHQIGLYDPELKDKDGEPLHLGEIQSLGQQVVGPGSIHPNGNRYEAINDAPILKISKADLLKIFDGLILTGIDDPAEEPRRSAERRRRAGGSSIGDSIPIDQVCWPVDVKERTGSEVIGSHPKHGSTTGKNFSVNTDKNCWHCFRCGPPQKNKNKRVGGGGGPLEWLAVEAGLISCKDAKPGCLDDKALFKKVLQIARDKGFAIPEQERPKAEEDGEPGLKTVSVDDLVGTIGFNPKSGKISKVVEWEDKKFLGAISDCAVYIHTETVSRDETEFVFCGTGAVDKRPVKFTLPAAALAESRKFKAALINAFGAKNKVGDLTFAMVQEITCNPRMVQRIEVPTWSGNIPLLPGLNLADDVEYRLSSKIPAEVCDGDLQAAKVVLRTLLMVHKFAPLLVVMVLGAPAIARRHKKERFGLGIWGLTGTLKTSTVLACMGFYGTGYLNEPTLKAGQHGSTVVGAMEIFAAAGFLPQLYDNVKTVNQKDIENYVGMVHAVLEGSDKARGKKDGGLRESREFSCGPIITGEVRPQEAATSARVMNLNWSGANSTLLTEVQSQAALLPVIGYHWLRFLADTDLVLCPDFEAFRDKKMQEFLKLHYTNPGRLATIYSLLVGTWQLLEESPLGDVFIEAHESFKAALQEAITSQGQAVSEETEIARFLGGLEELIASNPGLIMSEAGTKTIVGGVIGKWMHDGLFLLPTETLNELMRIRAFTQIPTVDSMTQALNEKGYLIPDPDGKHLKYRMRLNGGRPWGWYIKEVAPLKNEPSPVGGDTKNDNSGANVPTVPMSPPKKKENVFDENFGDFQAEKDLDKNTGDSGDSGDRDSIDRLVDSDFDSKVSVPSSVPTCPQCVDDLTPEQTAGFQKFKAGMKKRTCCLCGRTFPYDLTPYFNKDKTGFICATCHMEGPPAELEEANPQTTLEA